MASRCGSPNLTADVGKNKWVGVSPPLPRVIARQADRTGSDNEGIVFHGAVGRSENGGGSKRVWVWVFEEKRSGFPTRGWAVRRARNRQTKELIQTAAWPTLTFGKEMRRQVKVITITAAMAIFAVSVGAKLSAGKARRTADNCVLSILHDAQYAGTRFLPFGIGTERRSPMWLITYWPSPLEGCYRVQIAVDLRDNVTFNNTASFIQGNHNK